MTKGNKARRGAFCIRCGECCRGSSPTLQLEDAALVKGGGIETAQLYTIREGELVWDNVQKKLNVTREELIKVRETTGSETGCVYYNEDVKACRIYDQRPAQCRALECWDVSEFERVYAGPKAKRRDIIRDGVLLGLMEEHDRRCSYRKLGIVVRQIEEKGEKAVERIIETLKFDYALRPLVSKKLGIPLYEMELVFGRPLMETLIMFGLRVIKQPDGSFFLTRAKQT